MALWWKSMRGFVNKSQCWQKQPTGSDHISKNQRAAGFVFSENIKQLRRRDILWEKHRVPDDEVVISHQIWFHLFRHHTSSTYEATFRRLKCTMSWALQALRVGEIRGSWNERRWRRWQQEPLLRFHCLTSTDLFSYTEEVLLKQTHDRISTQYADAAIIKYLYPLIINVGAMLYVVDISQVFTPLYVNVVVRSMPKRDINKSKRMPDTSVFWNTAFVILWISIQWLFP